MFYTKGIDITNDKQMFNFLKNHFEYFTLNSWNGLKTIANNVKMYNLQLSGDWYNAYNFLVDDEYEILNQMIGDWQAEHPGYEVYFNGRTGGYLVLTSTNNNGNVLPYFIDGVDTYEEYKEYCKEYSGSVKANRDELIYFTKLVQDFDKLCDELRDYCDTLSKLKFEVVAMEKAVETFNDLYEDDLELIGFRKLYCDEDGKVDVSEIVAFSCLHEAFCRIADRRDNGYILRSDEPGIIRYVEN